MRLRYYAMVAYNWLQGCRFFWVPDNHPAGGYFDMTEKTCPYPLRFDWSVRACVKAGDCGCSKGVKHSPPQKEIGNG
jgi:hypothetical protein